MCNYSLLDCIEEDYTLPTFVLDHQLHISDLMNI